MIKARFDYNGDKDLVVFGLRKHEMEKLLAGEALTFTGDTLSPDMANDPAMCEKFQVMLITADNQADLHARVNDALGVTVGTS